MAEVGFGGEVEAETEVEESKQKKKKKKKPGMEAGGWKKPKEEEEVEMVKTSIFENEWIDEEGPGFFCKLCRKKYKSEGEIRNHLKSKQHLKGLKELKEKEKEEAKEKEDSGESGEEEEELPKAKVKTRGQPESEPLEEEIDFNKKARRVKAKKKDKNAELMEEEAKLLQKKAAKDKKKMADKVKDHEAKKLKEDITCKVCKGRVVFESRTKLFKHLKEQHGYA
jgi:hypothetical protein